ncbi:MAG: hypothetical protein M1429_02215 [Patescibacteria group bacterium]|nr:hypothetical protein [Patescibacteria group bacterium]
MIAYKTKKHKIPGSSFKEINKIAKHIFKQIQSRTKRTPYIKSKYFQGQKIFLNLFWHHLFEKHESDRVRRLKYFDCALDLIKNSTCKSTIKENPNKRSELLYRFMGITQQGEKFYVQIKENKISGRKDLISIVPE